MGFFGMLICPVPGDCFFAITCLYLFYRGKNHTQKIIDFTLKLDHEIFFTLGLIHRKLYRTISCSEATHNSWSLLS